MILLAIALIGMVVMVEAKGVAEDTTITWIFAILAVTSTVLCVRFMRKMRLATKEIAAQTELGVQSG